MAYEVRITPTALKQLSSIPLKFRKTIDEKLRSLAENPRPDKAKALSGKIKNLFRIRVGDYRIVYRIDDQILVVLVIRIGHRREVYRRL